MDVFVEALTEMGFPRQRAEKAVKETNNRSVQDAMEWLLAHPEDEKPGEKMAESSGSGEVSEEDNAMQTEEGEEMDTSAAQARSLKCEDCGKLLRSETEAEAHAIRTQHSNFSESTEEIKPLTAEEKAEQLAKIQERMKKNRLEREEKEKQEAKEQEKRRRAQGKDITLAKFEHEQKEMKLIAEQKRREKMEDKLAKQKVLDDIKRDKERRAAEQAAVKASTSGASVATSIPAAAAVAQSVVQPVEKKEYTQCKLQIRLPTGQPLIGSFKPNECLGAVRLFVSMNNPDLGSTFKLMTNFPKKVFTDEDMEKPLSALDLVPSAVLLVVTK